MTEISKAAKVEAVRLANINRIPIDHWTVDEFEHLDDVHLMCSLARVLQEHSDKAMNVYKAGVERWSLDEADVLISMILPNEPDPLEEIITTALPGVKYVDGAAHLRKAMREAGYEIRKVERT